MSLVWEMAQDSSVTTFSRTSSWSCNWCTGEYVCLFICLWKMHLLSVLESAKCKCDGAI